MQDESSRADWGSPGDTNRRSVGQAGPLDLGRRSARGVQLEDVLGAADALVDAGLKPTIERVRQKLGRGSPNTVSPMLDVWFSTLGQRLKGVRSVADEEARKLPLEVVQIAQQFGDLATHNARQAQIQQTEATRREPELQQAALEARELHLQQREAAFEETRQRLNAALASSQQEREALGRQLTDQAALAQEQAADASRHRRVLEPEVARLDGAIAQLQTDKDQLRSQHAVALAAQERDARESEERHIERHVATERRPWRMSTGPAKRRSSVGRGREGAHGAHAVGSGTGRSARAGRSGGSGRALRRGERHGRVQCPAPRGPGAASTRDAGT